MTSAITKTLLLTDPASQRVSTFEFIKVLIVCCLINTAIFVYHPPVFFIPDLFLLAYVVYKFRDLDQEVSLLFFAGIFLFWTYFVFSPEALDTQFANNYWLVLKPFVYICILALYSKNYPFVPLYKWARMFLGLYPCILLWNLYLVHWKENANLGHLLTIRPYFIFENNFEITFYLNCFIIVFFIYQERKWRDFLILGFVIAIAGSRSGLLSFAAVCVYYFLAVSWRQKLGVLVLAGLAAFYIGRGRNISAPLNTIDRVQSLQAILEHYQFSFLEMLKEPFGYGIYQKVPGYVCSKLPDFAEWFTGNSHNCDPLMLQAFYTRALYQYGIYVTVLIPLIFFLIVKKEMGWKLALIVLTPITCVATSVGGFSNGLAFLGVLVSTFAYAQLHAAQDQQTMNSSYPSGTPSPSDSEQIIGAH